LLEKEDFVSFQFDVGQHVVCVDMTPRARGLSPTYADTRFPVVGGIYTIRRIYDARPLGHDDLAILLREVRNRPRPYMSATGRDVRCEQFWLGFRFRPVRPTSIDVFRRLLESVPAEDEPNHLGDFHRRLRRSEDRGGDPVLSRRML
jgi:hypothetical protein